MMDPLRKILVPVDGSTSSESVFPAIMPLVRAFGPDVLLLHVIENPAVPYTAPERVSSARSALRAANVKASIVLRDGHPADEILRVAREKGVDLMAMSTEGRGGVRRLIAGSVAESVLRQAEVPVLLTRPGIPVHDWKTIAVALDGSARAEEILPEVVRLARTLNATVEVLQAAQPVIAAAAGESVVVLPPADPMPYLQGIVERIKAQGVKAVPVGLEGPAAEAVVKRLKDAGTSLLCLTTHGRSGLQRLLLGSVAESIVRHAPCPVLLHRAEGLAPAGEGMVLNAGLVF